MDREVTQQKQAIDSLQAELGQYGNKGYLPKGFDKLAELQAKLRDSEGRNHELQTEVRHMQKIQNDQARALEKISDENDYPSRINAMLEELRCSKERNRMLE